LSINKGIIAICMLLGFLIPQDTLSQQVEVNDDLGDVTDEFQEYFFEALKQRGIENYEKASTSKLVKTIYYLKILKRQKVT